MRLDNIRSKCECPEKLDQLIRCWRNNKPKSKQDWEVARDTEIGGLYFWAQIGGYTERKIFKFELDSIDRGPRSKVHSDLSRLKLGGVPEEILGPHQERIKQFLKGVRGAEPTSESYPPHLLPK